MGYRSTVVCKTTTEGYLLLKKKYKEAKDVEQILKYAEILKTPEGFYKVRFDDIKWYEGYPSVDLFMDTLRLFEEVDIPYKFIRIGEDRDDIEFRENYTDDMPDQICEFDPEVSIYDVDEGNYEVVEEVE